MAEKEMEYRVELFNKMTQTCFKKCVDERYKESELNMGENSCIDRCVSKYWQASTNVNVHQDLKDVKLWQVHTLSKGLEKIAASVDIPMLVCGDFNSVPRSAPHALLAMGNVDSSYPDLTVDPLNILRPHSKLVHQLPLRETSVWKRR
ncbi:carbon catabolite repressor protein 4 homolog 2-like isoform X3 [Vigna angularis]|nr:carbon catabolite repressor protein 4 homolog 2-like isoform X3 [Vigna angularis]XP_052728866.1 carbon catabolite repressor protein 4 homolog 2-like isoform X3 [Vigna angularis]